MLCMYHNAILHYRMIEYRLIYHLNLSKFLGQDKPGFKQYNGTVPFMSFIMCFKELKVIDLDS